MRTVYVDTSKLFVRRQALKENEHMTQIRLLNTLQQKEVST